MPHKTPLLLEGMSREHSEISSTLDTSSGIPEDLETPSPALCVVPLMFLPQILALGATWPLPGLLGLFQ